MKHKKMTAGLIAMAALTGITLCGCGDTIDSDAAFATLDDTTITMGVANLCAKYQQVSYDTFWMAYYGENMWSSDLFGNGNTLEQDVKTQVADSIQEMYLLKAHMADYDVEITQEEEDAMAKAADTFLSENSKAAIKQMGAENRDDLIEMLRLNTIQNKMENAIREEANADVTDEEAAQRTFSYVEIDMNGKYDENNEYVEFTEDEKAEVKVTAEKIAGADDFDTAVTDAGYTVSTESYGSAEDTDATLDAEVLKAADALKEGEVSGVVETDSSYYVIRLDSEYDKEASEEKKEQLISQKRDDYYEDVLSGWRDEAKWEINEKEWEKVTFEDHFTLPQDTESEEAVLDSTESMDGTESEIE